MKFPAGERKKSEIVGGPAEGAVLGRGGPAEGAVGGRGGPEEGEGGLAERPKNLEDTHPNILKTPTQTS